jgi:predicted DNA-binding protein with PD1-like motif
VKVRSIESGFLLRLDKGEEVISSLSGFCEKENIGFASVNGIGAASKAILAVFDTKKKEYIERTFEGDLEIVSLMGNITVDEGKPKVHLHACISGHDYLARSGHLISANISVTCEIVLNVAGQKVERKKDEETGLMLID